MARLNKQPIRISLAVIRSHVERIEAEIAWLKKELDALEKWVEGTQDRVELGTEGA